MRKSCHAQATGDQDGGGLFYFIPVINEYLYSFIDNIQGASKEDKTLSALVLDSTATQLDVVLANNEKAAKILGSSDSQEGELMKDLGLKSWKDSEKGEVYFQDRRFYGDGLGIILMIKF